MSGAAPEAAVSPPPKEDPETLVLRGRPRPVVRFRRGLIAALAGGAAAILAAIAWLALDPPALNRAGSGDGDGEPRRSGIPAAVADAPAAYGEVPELGPPLPGDLGRAIVAHERALEAPAARPDGSSPEGAAREAAEAERQRRVAERAAARASPLMVPQQARAEAPEPSPVPAADRREPVRRAPSPWTLTAGTVIPASLVTGIDSGLPGPVVAQVTENVRDSATGRVVLVPQGARLIGRYDSEVAYGQRRALVVWQRIVFPDGSSVALGEMPATDRAGYAGLEDRVDVHAGRLLRGIGLSTLLGVGTEIGLGDDEGDLARALRESGQDTAARAGERIVARDLEAAPTLTVRPGWPVRALVHEDLVLAPWQG